eukprot:789691-Pleurochrysis_carterae.AAC.1
MCIRDSSLSRSLTLSLSRFLVFVPAPLLPFLPSSLLSQKARRSTTTSRSVALEYASRQPEKLAILLVVQQGMVDRGGDPLHARMTKVLIVVCSLAGPRAL